MRKSGELVFPRWESVKKVPKDHYRIQRARCLKSETKFEAMLATRDARSYRTHFRLANR